MENCPFKEVNKLSYLTFILKTKTFLIPTDFLSLSDVDPMIYAILSTTHRYEVKSNVSEEIFQSFINHWVKKETPNIQHNNIVKYEMLSQEFDRMKDLIRFYRYRTSNPRESFLIASNEKRKEKLKTKQSLNKKNTIKYQQIIHHLFTNTGIDSCSRFLTVKFDLFEACCKGKIKLVDILTRKEKDNTAGIFCCYLTNREIIIPRSIRYRSKEYLVTTIHQGSFESIKTEFSVTFPPDSELKTIEKRAFQNSSIQSITFPSHVTRIGRLAFYNCNKLTMFEFAENSELNTIEEFAFSDTNGICRTVPSSIENTSEWCFDFRQRFNIMKCDKVSIKYFTSKFVLSKSDIKVTLSMFFFMYFPMKMIKL